MFYIFGHWKQCFFNKFNYFIRQTDTLRNAKRIRLQNRYQTTVVHNGDMDENALAKSKLLYQFMGVNFSLATSSNVKSITEAVRNRFLHALMCKDDFFLWTQNGRSSGTLDAASVIDLTLELVARLQFTPINWYTRLLSVFASLVLSSLCTTVIWDLCCRNMRFVFGNFSVCLSFC